VEDLTIRPMEDWPANLPINYFAESNFSRGIVTFQTGYIFRTPPGWSLLATGPFNEPRRGIYPLTGIIETDWLPYPFTMNWKLLAPGTVRFEQGEVFCAIMPIPKGYLDTWEVAVHDLADDPVLSAEHETFRLARDSLMKRIRAKEPEALKQAWQRHYFVGRHPDGTRVTDHTTKLRLSDPQNRSGNRPLYAKETPSSAEAAKILVCPAKAVPAETEPKAEQTPQPKIAQPVRWRIGSRLTTLERDQTARNRAGRDRVREGILQPSPETVTYVHEKHAGSLDFICEPGFLSEAECADLASAAKMLSNRHNDPHIPDPFWRSRITFFTDVTAADRPAAEIMRRAQYRITERLAEFYELTQPLYADTVQLVQWPEGIFMPPHADRANSDGRAHDFPHRDFASLVYLNDDYEGGELYFPRLDLVLRPTRGMMVAFTGDWAHEHGVLKVRKGLRLTMPAFYTFTEDKRDRTFYTDSG
jgi:hypothetical protein